MKIEIYRRKNNHDAAAMLEGLTKTTKLVEVDQAEYDPAVPHNLEFEDRILGDRESILTNEHKVLGIIDMELFMASRMNNNYFREGDIVNTPFGLRIKTSFGFLPVKLKN